ncbi:rod-binding protein [Oceanibium sediminis]|uniref:rod-binding protein n=1 Tax=Oceanibium sediminis TaxID=2026339 RepID=UPI000DD4068A|nr:rod-binding protein [Oceanibium sediminis]
MDYFPLTTAVAPTGPSPETGRDPGRPQELRSAATALEQSFLAEMLRHSGVGTPPEGVNGGAGEDAFAGFLADAYADHLTRAGGLGLAEQIFQSLLASSTEAAA